MYLAEFEAIEAKLLDHNQKQIVLDTIEELMKVRCPLINAGSFSC